jgi:hypothetical protein
MSPTVFRRGPYRFFFFSKEESRAHVHVNCSDGEAKFWIKPTIAMAYNKGLTKKQIGEMAKLVEEHRNEIHKAWQEHFGR